MELFPIENMNWYDKFFEYDDDNFLNINDASLLRLKKNILIKLR